MNSNTVARFVKCLVKGLRRKFSDKEEEEETPADKLCDELLEFSQQFRKYVLEEINKIPAKVIDIEDFFIRFLNSMCSRICKEQIDCEDSDERRFFAMSGFIMNVATLAFAIPCYRLMRNVTSVLITQLQTNLSLNLDSEVRVAFENLEGKCLPMASDGHWVRECLRLYLRSIPYAVAPIPVKEKRPDVGSRLLNLVDVGTSNSADDDSRQNEECKFCSKDCKPLCDAYLNFDPEKVRTIYGTFSNFNF